jgi:nucleoside-diphosphate-sugar epimerase/acyl carrier protein
VLWGVGRTFALEHPEHWGGLIDLPGSYDEAASAAAVEAELRAHGVDDQVVIRRKGRFVPRLARKALAGSGPASISGDRTYIVTGGLGALGLHITAWLVARGAKHLLLTSRRGADSPNAAGVRSLEARGVSIRIIGADVASADGVDAILAAVPDDAPLGGIIHAAGVDDVTPVLETKRGEATRIMAAKAAGAWLLHERTRELPLDAFVCFSSIAAVLGSPGRAAYAGANAFLDAVAHERRRAGLPALSINWGPWTGGGMATGTALEQYARAGNHGLAATDALAVMERVFQADAAQVMIADVDWESFRAGYEARRVRPLIAELRDVQPAARKAEPAVGKAPWIERLAGLAAEQRLPELTALLRSEVAQTLGLDGPSDVAPDQVFREIGVDSLMAAELAQRLQKRLGVKSTAMVFDHPTVIRLATHLLEKLPLPAPADVPVAVAETVPQAATLPAAAARAHLSATTDVEDALAMYFTSESEPSSRPATAEGTERYSRGLEPDVFAFQKRAYPHRREDLIAPRWQWMFVESAARLRVTPQVWVHREAGQVVGHNGAIPVRLKIGDEECLTGWLVDTMVLPDYRDRAIGARLMVEAHEDMPLALSLGQTEQMRAIQFRLGWQQVAPLQTAQLLIRPERVFKGKLPASAALAAGFALRAGTALRTAMKGKAGGWTRELSSFDESHDRLWDVCSRELRCAVRRDASYLNWKYVDQPGQDFLRLEMRSPGGGRGVVVLMFRDPDNAYQYRRAFIVDLVAPLSNDELMADLLMAATKAAAERGADALVCLHVNRRLTDCLLRAGFRMREPTRYLLVRPETVDDRLRRQLLDPDGWFVTQGDSDIDRPW